MNKSKADVVIKDTTNAKIRRKTVNREQRKFEDLFVEYDNDCVQVTRLYHMCLSTGEEALFGMRKSIDSLTELVRIIDRIEYAEKIINMLSDSLALESDKWANVLVKRQENQISKIVDNNQRLFEESFSKELNELYNKIAELTRMAVSVSDANFEDKENFNRVMVKPGSVPKDAVLPPLNEDLLDSDDAFEMKTDFYYDLVSKVVERRNELQLTQYDLAQKAGIDRVTLAKFETRKKMVGIDTIFKIISSLGLKISID